LAVKIVNIDARNNTVELQGLSTDDKPVGDIDGIIIGSGSTFYEVDTKAGSVMHDNTWYEV
jgi:hypothetical protein